MESNNIQKMHDEHQEWIGEITSWHNELVYYNRVLLRLLEGAKAESDTNRMEEFKSRFDALEEHFEKMRKSIGSHEKHLEENAGHISDQHIGMQERVKDFKSRFQALKNDFYVFEEKFIYE